MKIKEHITKLFALLMIFCFFAVAYAETESNTPDGYKRKAAEAKKHKSFIESSKCGLLSKLTEPNCCTKSDVNGGKEFIKVKTVLSYSQDRPNYPGQPTKMKRTYGDPNIINEKAPVFERSTDVILTIEFYPEMIDDTKYICTFDGLKADNLLIPVEIETTKPRSVSVTYEGGLNKRYVQQIIEKDANGTGTFRFYLSLGNPIVPRVIFKIHPSGSNADMDINIRYSNDEYKYVNSNFELTDHVTFKKLL